MNIHNGQNGKATKRDVPDNNRIINVHSLLLITITTLVNTTHTADQQYPLISNSNRADNTITWSCNRGH